MYPQTPVKRRSGFKMNANVSLLDLSERQVISLTLHLTCTSSPISVPPVESGRWCQHPWSAAVGHSHERFRWPGQVSGVGPEWAAVEYACVGNNLPHVQRPGKTEESLGGTRMDLQLFCFWAVLLSLQTPETLVSAGHARSAEEKQRDSQELEALRQKEHAEKRSRTLQRGTRYNQADIQPAFVKRPCNHTAKYISLLCLHNTNKYLPAREDRSYFSHKRVVISTSEHLNLNYMSDLFSHKSQSRDEWIFA